MSYICRDISISHKKDMNKGYNNEMITAYLLGTLPEVEAEHFDELSFTDDNFADELKAAEKDLVDAYVSGELRGTTLEQFESYYQSSPIRRGKVKFARAFQEFGERNTVEKTIAQSKSEKTLTKLFSGIFAFQRPLLQWGFAAAALILVIFGGLVFLENSRLRFEMNQTQAMRDELLKRQSDLQQREKRLQNEADKENTNNTETALELAEIRKEREKLQQQLKQSQQQIAEQKRLDEQRADTKKQTTPAPNRQTTVAAFTLAPALRGSNQLPTLSIPANTDSAQMRLELESDDYPVYRVALRNLSDGRILRQSGKIKSKSEGANKILNVLFPAKLFKSQIYSLQVSGISADGSAEIISDYSFKIVR